MTLADLAAYRAKVRTPLRFGYRGLDVQVMPPPSGGGVALAQTLMMLERLGAHEQQAGSAEELHLFIEASRRAHAQRRFGVVDPDSLSEEQRALRRARWTDPTQLFKRAPPVDPSRATPSSKVHPLYPKAMQELEHTTHFAVIDREGNVASCTTTLSAGFGAKLVISGTGVVLNNSMAAFSTAGESNVLFPLKAMVIARRERPQGTRSPRGVYLEIIQEDTERFGRLCDFADGRWRPGTRRQAPRFRAEIRTSYFMPPNFYWGETTDISAQGVFLRTDEVMPQVGEGVFIRLHAWRLWFPIKLSARVCWIDEVDTRRGMGLFCFDTPGSLKRLAGLVQRLKKRVKI